MRRILCSGQYRKQMCVLGLMLILLQGCMAQVYAPSPFDVGRECEPSEDKIRRYGAGVALGALALSGIALATIPSCNSVNCSGYEGFGNVIVAGPIAGSLAIYGFAEWLNGAHNAAECRLYLESFAKQLRLEAQRNSRQADLDRGLPAKEGSKGDDGVVKEADLRDDENAPISKPTSADDVEDASEATPIVPIRGDDPK